MSEKTLQAIKELLVSTQCSFRHVHHDTIPTDSKGASKLRGTTHEHGAKALVLQTKSKEFIQVIVPAQKKVSLKKVRKFLHEKSVSLAHPNEVKEVTDCVIGSVPPFGVLWNIRVLTDPTIKHIEEVVFSAGTLEDSIFISPDDLISLNQASVVDVLKEE